MLIGLFYFWPRHGGDGMDVGMGQHGERRGFTANRHLLRKLPIVQDQVSVRTYI